MQTQVAKKIEMFINANADGLPFGKQVSSSGSQKIITWHRLHYVAILFEKLH